MQKDFEAQKIKLKSFIDENIAVSFDEHFCIHELIDTLQPPKPPTCSTCDYLTGGRCEIGVTDRWLEAGDGFGCLHHSDYEVAE